MSRANFDPRMCGGRAVWSVVQTRARDDQHFRIRRRANSRSVYLPARADEVPKQVLYCQDALLSGCVFQRAGGLGSR
jgi:hypothetical protein